MRRWNGWGDDGLDFPLEDHAREFLVGRIGEGTPPQDAELSAVLASVPASRLEGEAGLNTDPQIRLRHAHGESFPDLLALRSGRCGPYPEAVAFPENHDEVVALVSKAKDKGWKLLPYGGGTSVVGHLTLPGGGPPVVCVNMSRMNRLLDLDETSRIATMGAGVAGPDLEAQLSAKGYVLGHFPQSFEYSTLGGWVVTRSSGQQSLRYGRIEQLFAGGRLAAPAGEMDIPVIPASSAGPDLREWVMGSEGLMGVLTEAKVRVTPLPEHETFHAVFLPDWDSAKEAVRALAQAKVPLSMLRLSNEVETDTQLRLAGHATAIAWLKRYLGLRGVGEGMCMLMMGVTGSKGQAHRMLREALGITRQFRGVHLGSGLGKTWAQKRFLGPYLRNRLWEAGYAADTIESSVVWPRVTPLMRAMESRAHDALAAIDEKVHAFTHLSHVYAQGSSIYSTYIYRIASDPDEMHERWYRLKSAVSQAIVEHGGTISHQHGVGIDHAPYLEAEKGALGISTIKSAVAHLDPEGLMQSNRRLLG